MKTLLLLAIACGLAGFQAAWAQDYQPPRGKAGSNKTKTKIKRPPPTYSPVLTAPGRPGDDEAPAPLPSRKKLEHPVLVFYHQAPPGQVAQQLVMDEEDLVLLTYLTPAQLLSHRDVLVDGLGNLALPGTNPARERLLGTSALAAPDRRPAGDGHSFYARLKVPAPGYLYVVRESAEEYRHFVQNGRQGARLDFQTNGLPGVDSVRAAYTLRRVAAAERGAGQGATVR